MSNTILFDESNPNWSSDSMTTELFLRSINAHFNNVLLVDGRVFLNDILAALGMPRTRYGQIHGWALSGIDPEFDTNIQLRCTDLGHNRVSIMLNVQGDILDTLP